MIILVIAVCFFTKSYNGIKFITEINQAQLKSPEESWQCILIPFIIGTTCLLGNLIPIKTRQIKKIVENFYYKKIKKKARKWPKKPTNGYL